MTLYILVNIGSDNGLVPCSPMLLPQPKLPYLPWHPLECNFTDAESDIGSRNHFENCISKFLFLRFLAHLSRANELNSDISCEHGKGKYIPLYHSNHCYHDRCYIIWLPTVNIRPVFIIKYFTLHNKFNSPNLQWGTSFIDSFSLFMYFFH